MFRVSLKDMLLGQETFDLYRDCKMWSQAMNYGKKIARNDGCLEEVWTTMTLSRMRFRLRVYIVGMHICRASFAIAGRCANGFYWRHAFRSGSRYSAHPNAPDNRSDQTICPTARMSGTFHKHVWELLFKSTRTIRLTGGSRN